MKQSLINWTYQCIESKDNDITPPNDLRHAISQIKQLPPLPGIATRLMKLKNDPLADDTKLAEIIELDPLLTTQVIRWASSALYGYKGEISSVRIAINRVLGYQFVFDLVLGLSALKPLDAPTDGIIGTYSFWNHALLSTHLMKGLNDLLPQEQKFDAQTIFFVALMHNIGLPLLGDQFKDEFNALSMMVEANPNLSIPKLEKFALGVDHCELGCWLLKSWDMPAAVIDVVYNHHNPHYRGKHYQLNLLTYLNDSLLNQVNMGDAPEQRDCTAVFEELGLNQEDCQALLEQVALKIEAIKSLVKMLVDN